MVLNCSALGLGARSPKRIFAAYVRGRRSRNLYGFDTETMMDLPLSTVRSLLGLDRSHRDGTFVDLLRFTATIPIAAAVGMIPFIVSVVTSPIWLAKGVHRQRRMGGVVSPWNRHETPAS